MKKQLVIALLSILLIVVIVLAGCGPKTTTVTTSTTTTTTATTTKVLKPVEIIWADTTPAQAPKSRYIQEVAKEITDATGGLVTFTFYWSNSLMPQGELFKGIQEGVADICYFPLDINIAPLSWGMCGLPFMGVPNMEKGTQIWWDLYDEFPQVRAEWEGVKIMSSSMMPPQQLHTTGKVVRVPNDLRNMKVIASGETAKVVAAAGATPVEVGVQDLYMSLNSALTEAFINHWPVMNVFGVQPLLKYHANFGEGGWFMTPHMILMNPAKFNALPAEWQELFVKKFKEYELGIMALDNQEIERTYKEANDTGQNTQTLTSQEIQQWVNLALPLHADYIKKLEGMGYTGVQAVFDRSKELIAAAQ